MASETVSWEIRELLVHAIELKFPERHYCRDKALLELAISQVTAYPEFIGKYLDRPWSNLSSEERVEQARLLAAESYFWQDVGEVIGEADDAVTRNPDDGRMIQRWDHQPPHVLGGKTEVDNSASMDALSRCVTSYRRNTWATSPTLELWMVRQLIFAETFALGREMGLPIQFKSYKFWWIWTKSLVKWGIGLGVAFSIGDAHGAAIGVLTYVAWVSLTRYLAQDQIDRLTKQEETFNAMRVAYVLSLRTPACPVEIEKGISQAEAQRAIWPAGLRSLVEMGVSRNRAFWI